MEMLETIRRLWAHARWADAALLDRLEKSGGAAPEALGELAHVLGAYEVWLARLEGRTPRAPVWPEASIDEVKTLIRQLESGYGDYLSRLSAASLGQEVSYANSAGKSFTNSVGDILMHVFLHGQYHRGKVNALLREAALEPAPSDYIAFVRGAPAATRS